MKLHNKTKHHLSGVYAWGQRNEIDLRVNLNVFKARDTFPHDPLHFHKTRTTYFCIISGDLFVHVGGKELHLTQEQMLEIEPQEIYKTVRIGDNGCTFIVIGSHNEKDRVEV